MFFFNRKYVLRIFNYIYQEIFKNDNTHTLMLVSHFVQIIAYLSSALNPFIYSYMSEAFRTNLQLTFTNCCCFTNNDQQVVGSTPSLKEKFQNHFKSHNEGNSFIKCTINFFKIINNILKIS